MPQIDWSRLRPGYNISAAACSLAAAPWWAAQLTRAASEGQLAPLGLTVAAIVGTATTALVLPCWPTRALAFAPITAFAFSPAAAHAALTLATGAHP